MATRGKTLAVLGVLAAAWLVSTGEAAAIPATKVYLNGHPSPVYFNDGDSFRVLAGPYAGTKARLAGFNTLESYGNVHAWGGWTERELYVNAKLGTLNARQGVWNCTSDLKRDGYGRILWVCPDLAENQIGKGLAHAMTVTKEGARPRYVMAQRAAQRAKRGMWAHGVPDYVLTSLHSVTEPYSRGNPYNRLVSTVDGHSERWRHKDAYNECDKVCWYSVEVTEAVVRQAVATLKANAELTEILGNYTDDQIAEMARWFIGHSNMDGKIDWKHQGPVRDALIALRATGAWDSLKKKKDSCMVYAPFNRRYGKSAAACLH